MTNPAYVTREALAAASDVKASAYASAMLDRLCQTASRGVERSLHRTFYPTIATKTWDLPPRGTLFTPDDLISLTSMTLDAVAVTGATLGPTAYGAPYGFIDLDDATASSGSVIAVTGVWGYSSDTVAAGALAAAITTTSATTLTVTNAALVGVGDQLLIDSERLVVTGRASATTSTTLNGDMTASAADTSLDVADGTKLNVGETVSVDSERMLVLDIVSNLAIVKRAVDGTVLAAHTSGATVYAQRLLTVERANAGTTAATHLISAAITRNVAPSLITELCLAEAQAMLGQEQAGWNLTVGTGENARESSGKSVYSLRKIVAAEYGRGRYSRVA